MARRRRGAPAAIGPLSARGVLGRVATRYFLVGSTFAVACLISFGAGAWWEAGKPSPPPEIVRVTVTTTVTATPQSTATVDASTITPTTPPVTATTISTPVVTPTPETVIVYIRCVIRSVSARVTNELAAEAHVVVCP